MSIKLKVVKDSLQAHFDYVDLCLRTPSPEQDGDIMELLFTTIGRACNISAEELSKGEVYNAHDKMCFVYRVIFPHKYCDEIITFVKDNQESLQVSLDEILLKDNTRL